jgi:hypothetical protein
LCIINFNLNFLFHLFCEIYLLGGLGSKVNRSDVIGTKDADSLEFSNTYNELGVAMTWSSWGFVGPDK